MPAHCNSASLSVDTISNTSPEFKFKDHKYFVATFLFLSRNLRSLLYNTLA